MQKLFLRFRVKTSLLISENVDTELVYNFNVIIIIVFFHLNSKYYNYDRRHVYITQYTEVYILCNILCNLILST